MSKEILDQKDKNAIGGDSNQVMFKEVWTMKKHLLIGTVFPIKRLCWAAFSCSPVGDWHDANGTSVPEVYPRCEFGVALYMLWFAVH